MDRIYIPKQDFEILVLCATFNHGRYIRDTLNGFRMQMANFPFVCLVIDDCSTDGEQDVIRAWIRKECDLEKAEYVELESAEIIQVPDRTNEKCHYAFYLLKKNLYGTSLKAQLIMPWRDHCRYEAICEGDDYWTDPVKLQTQFDVMEADPACTICMHRVGKVDADGNRMQGSFPEPAAGFSEGVVTKDKFIHEEFFHGRWDFQLSGCLFRVDNVKRSFEFRKTILSKYPFGDIPMILSHFLDGYGYYIDRAMSCYRVMSGGYNSEMAANPAKAIANQESIKAAMDDVDAYTEFRYHKAFMRKKLWCDLHIANMKCNANGGRGLDFVKLNPHFYPLVRPADVKHWVLCLMKIVSPVRLYGKVKGRLERMAFDRQRARNQQHCHDFPAECNGWKKVGNAPVYGDSGTGTVFDPYVLVHDGSFLMVVSERKTGDLILLKSKDGISWSERKTILAHRPGTWESIVNRGCLVHVDGTWHLWYTGQQGEKSCIGHAVSDDCFNFVRDSGNPVLVPGLKAEGTSVMNPCVIRDEAKGMYRMWYAAGENYEPDMIFHAESHDGKSWKKHETPVLSRCPGHEWEKYKVGGCDVKRLEDGSYVMFYIGYQNLDVTRICYAVSADGIAWERPDNNICLSPSRGSWDADACYKPAFVKAGDRKYLWYNGRRDICEYIGLATNDQD